MTPSQIQTIREALERIKEVSLQAVDYCDPTLDILNSTNDGWKTLESVPPGTKYILGGWWGHGWNVDQCFLTKEGEWWTNYREGEPTHWKPWDEPAQSDKE